MSVMKAIRVSQPGGPEVLKLEEVPDLAPGPGQVLIKVHAVGVNPVETYIRSGTYGWKQWPYTPGADSAGVVEAVGENVRKVKPGDRVYTAGSASGTYAQKTVAPEARVFRLPDKISFQQGAALGVPYGTAHRALFHRARPVAGETVLVHGASGGVGVASTQFARASGLNVIGTGGTDKGRQLVREQGAHHVLDHKSPDYLDQLMKLTEGRGVDIVLEMLANVNLAKDLTVLAKNGRVIVIGNRGTIEINPRETMGRDADVRGMTLFNATDADLQGIHAAIFAGLENGTLRPIVGNELPLADAAKAHAMVLEPGSYGKIVLIP
jgi:NADPH2:quinone reductase